jgi:hypothetical protein
MIRSMASLAVVLCLLPGLGGCGFGGGHGWFEPLPNSPPDVLAVSTTLGTFGDGATPRAYVTPAGTNIPLYVTFEGSEASSYSWDFGGAATPGSSASELPRLSLTTAGTYSCILTVTNAFGSDTFPFTLTVAAPQQPELIEPFFITPLDGIPAPVLVSGEDYGVYGSATAGAVDLQDGYGRPEAVWDWNFGGGSTPAADLNSQEYGYVNVTLGAPGTYHGTVTMTNGAGSDSIDFDYEVVAP